MKLRFEPIRIANTDDQEGRLVFDDDRLIAVLSHLTKGQGAPEGSWFTEALFGPLSLRDRDQATFGDLDQVRRWFEQQLG